MDYIDVLVNILVGGGVIGNHTMRIRPTDSNSHTHLNTTEYTSTAMEIRTSWFFCALFHRNYPFHIFIIE